MPYLAGHEPRILHEEILRKLEHIRERVPEPQLYSTLIGVEAQIGWLKKLIHQQAGRVDPKAFERQVREEVAELAATAMRLALDCDLKTRADR